MGLATTRAGRCVTHGVPKCDVYPFSANIATDIASQLQENTETKTSSLRKLETSHGRKHCECKTFADSDL